MKQKMIQPYSFVLICLCITQQARSKHLKEWVTRSGIEGKENLIDGAVPLDQFDSNECSVKTVDGPSPGQCCKFPFLYFGEERTSCVPGLFTNRKWCAVTYNYDEEKQWGWCPECSVKTVDGQSPDECCKFPFLYKGTNRTSCVKGITTNRTWCGVTYNYDQEKQWGWCPECSVKTVDGQSPDECCKFPFLYKGTNRTSCVKGITTNRTWCGVTYNYDQEKQWGWCPECSVKTVDGQSPDECCKFPFLYKGTNRTSCVKGITTNRTWCGVTYNYDQEKQWGWCPDNQPITTSPGETTTAPPTTSDTTTTTTPPGETTTAPPTTSDTTTPPVGTTTARPITSDTTTATIPPGETTTAPPTTSDTTTTTTPPVGTTTAPPTTSDTTTTTTPPVGTTTAPPTTSDTAQPTTTPPGETTTAPPTTSDTTTTTTPPVGTTTAPPTTSDTQPTTTPPGETTTTPPPTSDTTTATIPPGETTTAPPTTSDTTTATIPPEETTTAPPTTSDTITTTTPPRETTTAPPATSDTTTTTTPPVGTTTAPPTTSECSVKTVDGQSPDECCKFPFLYKGTNRTSCVKDITTNRTWCGVTYNYDQEKQWGWCPETFKSWSCEMKFLMAFKPVYEDFDNAETKNLAKKIVDSVFKEMFSIKFQGRYLGCRVQRFRRGSVIADMVLKFNESLGQSEVAAMLSEAASDGQIGELPVGQITIGEFIKPKNSSEQCTTFFEGEDRKKECSVKTVDGQSPDECCKFPFLYKGTNRTSCVKGITTNRTWCGVTCNYDQEKQWGWCPENPSKKKLYIIVALSVAGGLVAFFSICYCVFCRSKKGRTNKGEQRRTRRRYVDVVRDNKGFESSTLQLENIGKPVPKVEI
ncbi:uncharacterized protein LOC144639157 [Oculina patagonica]